MSTMDCWRPDPRAIYDPARPKPVKLLPTIRVRIIFVPWPEGSEESKEWKSKSEQWNLVRRDKYKIIYWDEHITDHPVLSVASQLSDSQIYIRGHGSPGAPAICTNVKEVLIPLEIEMACHRLIAMGLKPSFCGAIKFHFCYSGTIFATQKMIDDKVEKANTGMRGIGSTKQMLVDLEKERKEADGVATKYGNPNIFQKMGGAERKKQQAIATRDEKAKQIQGGQIFLRNQELKVPTGESLATKGANFMREKGFTHCNYYGYLGPVESEFGSLDANPTGPGDYHKFVNLEGLQNAPDGVRAGSKAERASVCRVRIL